MFPSLAVTSVSRRKDSVFVAKIRTPILTLTFPLLGAVRLQGLDANVPAAKLE